MSVSPSDIGRDLQIQVRNDRVMQTLNTHQGRAKDKLVLGEQIIPDLSIAIDRAATYAKTK